MAQPHPPRDNSGPSRSQSPSAYSIRLTPEAYQQVARQCKPLDVGTQTTELQAAFVLGQQSVLEILRKDIVIHAAS